VSADASEARTTWLETVAETCAASTRRQVASRNELYGDDRPARTRWLRAAAIGGSDALAVMRKLVSEDPSVAQAAETAGG
jgi:hypothetical protein